MKKVHPRTTAPRDFYAKLLAMVRKRGIVGTSNPVKARSGTYYIRLDIAGASKTVRLSDHAANRARSHKYDYEVLLDKVSCKVLSGCQIIRVAFPFLTDGEFKELFSE